MTPRTAAHRDLVRDQLRQLAVAPQTQALAPSHEPIVSRGAVRESAGRLQPHATVDGKGPAS
jgi:hypothetical protein